METKSDSKKLGFVKVTLGLLFALVLLPSNSKAIAIFLFGVAVFVHTLSRKRYFDKKFFFTNSVLFLAIASTFFYSDNTEYALRKLSQMASLIVFPFIFALLTEAERKSIFKDLKKYLWVYIIAVILFNLLPFLWFWGTHYSFSEMMEHFITLVRTRMGKFNIHPIYLSMHCAVAILFSFYILKGLRSKPKIGLLIVLDILLVLFLLLYAKKGPLIGLLVVFSLFIVFQRSQKLFKPYLLAIIAIIGLVIAIPNTRNKFVELLEIETIDKGTVTSTNIRYTIYDTAYELFQESPVIGYGIGDFNDVLRGQYKKDGKDLLVKGTYNAHNQFMSYLLIGGVLLLFLFLCVLAINLVYAIRFNNQLLILLLIFYGIVMLTENVLERESGIIYFALFLNFFSMKSLYTQGEEI